MAVRAVPGSTGSSGGVPGFLMSALAVGLCMSGLAVSVTALAELERRMTDVAQFRLRDRMRGYAQMRAASTEIAILLGQMIALILLTLLCMPSPAAHAAGPERPGLGLPAADGCAAGAPFAGGHRQHPALSHEQPPFSKLARWLTLESEGLTTPRCMNSSTAWWSSATRIASA